MPEPETAGMNETGKGLREGGQKLFDGELESIPAFVCCDRAKCTNQSEMLPHWSNMSKKNHKSNRIISLINKAATVAGNDTKLADLIGEGRGRMSSWRSGDRPCPIEAQILMAEIAGMDINEVMKDAILERNEESERSEKLKEVFQATSKGNE